MKSCWCSSLYIKKKTEDIKRIYLFLISKKDQFLSLRVYYSLLSDIHNISKTVIFLNIILSLKNKQKHSLIFKTLITGCVPCLFEVLFWHFSTLYKSKPKRVRGDGYPQPLYRGASGRKIKGVPYSFPMPREVGEQEAIKEKISIIHFSISCPSSSNRMESLKKSVQRAPYIINLVSLGCKLLYNRKSVFFLPMFWIVSCILTSQILNQSSLATKSIQKIVLFLLFFFHNIQGLSVSRWR